MWGWYAEATPHLCPPPPHGGFFVPLYGETVSRIFPGKKFGIILYEEVFSKKILEKNFIIFYMGRC